MMFYAIFLSIMSKPTLIDNDRKVKFTMWSWRETFEVPVIVYIERRTSLRDFVSLSEKWITRLLDFCKKSLCAERKDSAIVSTWEVLKTRDWLLLACSCVGWLRTHALLFEFFGDEWKLYGEITFLGWLSKREKKNWKYVWTDEILLCRGQIEALISYIQEFKDHVIAEKEVKCGNVKKFRNSKDFFQDIQSVKMIRNKNTS